MSRLSEVQISLHLKNLPQWFVEKEMLKKTFTFPKFTDSINFVNEVAALAEASNHHPDLLIEYKKVTVSLITHSHQGITGKDFLIAEQIDNIKL